MSHRENVAALARALGRSAPPATLSVLGRFAELVESWNRKMNLTAARQPRALSEVLFADAFELAEPVLIPTGSRVLDVGSGAGAPAIPVALLRPDLALTLVEPLHKRVAFMRHALGTLGLGDRVHVLERKLAPEDGEISGAPFDVSMSRATLAPSEWLALGLAHSPRVLVLTAAEAPPVRDDAKSVAEAAYSLPWSDAPRMISAYLRDSA